MSNPQDDPGHRPPPPRQGEPPQGAPSPYQGEQQQYQGEPAYQPGPGHYQGGPVHYEGGPAPYQGDPGTYQGEPGAYQNASPPYGYQSPPGPQWQGQGGYGGPQSHLQRRSKGFFGTLFDINFDDMVTTRLIKMAYALAILVYSLIALLMLLFAWSFFAWNKPLGFITLIATPIVWTAGLLTTRLVLEFVINQFKITEHLKALRDREGPR